MVRSAGSKSSRLAGGYERIPVCRDRRSGRVLPQNHRGLRPRNLPGELGSDPLIPRQPSMANRVLNSSRVIGFYSGVHRGCGGRLIDRLRGGDQLACFLPSQCFQQELHGGVLRWPKLTGAALARRLRMMSAVRRVDIGVAALLAGERSQAPPVEIRSSSRDSVLSRRASRPSPRASPRTAWQAVVKHRAIVAARLVAERAGDHWCRVPTLPGTTVRAPSPHPGSPAPATASPCLTTIPTARFAPRPPTVTRALAC